MFLLLLCVVAQLALACAGASEHRVRSTTLSAVVEVAIPFSLLWSSIHMQVVWLLSTSMCPFSAYCFSFLCLLLTELQATQCTSITLSTFDGFILFWLLVIECFVFNYKLFKIVYKKNTNKTNFSTFSDHWWHFFLIASTVNLVLEHYEFVHFLSSPNCCNLFSVSGAVDSCLHTAVVVVVIFRMPQCICK